MLLPGLQGELPWSRHRSTEKAGNTEEAAATTSIASEIADMKDECIASGQVVGSRSSCAVASELVALILRHARDGGMPDYAALLHATDEALARLDVPSGVGVVVVVCVLRL